MLIRTSLLGLAVAATIGLTACGKDSGISKQESQRLRDHAAQVQRDAQRAADEVRNGTKDPEQAAKEIQSDATDLTNEALDAAKDADLPADAQKALEDAQAQLNDAGNR